METINDLEINMNMPSLKINTTDDMVNAIQRKKFVVGSFTELNGFSIAENPFGHYTELQARTECARLSKLNANKMFIYLQVRGAEMTVNQPRAVSY